MYELIWTPNYDEMSSMAAEKMYRAVQQNPNAVIVFATGGSPLLAYRLLCKKILANKTDITGVTFVKLDEWLGLSPEDEATCEAFLRKELLEPLGVEEQRFIHFDPTAGDPEAECARFKKLYAALPQIDIVILGVGKNGHLGLNEPSDELRCDAHAIELTAKTKTHEMLTHTAVPVTHGITMGMREIFAGKQILLLAAGSEKQHLLPYFTNQSITTQLPFTLLKLHPNCVCLADRNAFMV